MSPVADGILKTDQLKIAGDIFFHERFFKEIEKVTRQVFEETEGLGWHQIKEYKLDKARTNERITDFPEDGDCILVLYIDGAAEIKLNAASGDAFDLAVWKRIRHQFEDLYLSNTAQSGLKLKLLIGKGDWQIEDTYPEIDLTGEIRNDLLQQITNPDKIGQIIKNSHVIPHADILCEKILLSGATRLDQWRNSDDYTYMDPGRILLHSTTKLSDWRHPSDLSLIAGGQIFTHSIEADKLSILTHILSGATWLNNSPVAGKVAWSGAKLTYNGHTYTITNGNTDKKYIWWDFSLSVTTFQTSDTQPTLADQDCIVAYNNSGTHILIWNATLIDGRNIRTGTVEADKLSVAILSAITANIGTVTAGLVQSTDGKTLFDLTNGYMSVSDGVYTRFKTGKLNGDYGTEVRDADGILTIDKGEVTERWRMIWEKDISEARASVDLAGLDGNTDVEYRIVTRWVSGTITEWGLRFNDDAAARYGNQALWGTGAGAGAQRNVGNNWQWWGETDTIGTLSHVEGSLYAKSGKARTTICLASREVIGTSVLYGFLLHGVWNVAGGNLTKITFLATNGNGIGIGSHLEVWKRVP